MKLKNMYINQCLQCIDQHLQNLDVEFHPPSENRKIYENLDVIITGSVKFVNKMLKHKFIHVLTQCPAYQLLRKVLFDKAKDINSDFINMNNEQKSMFELSNPEIAK
jgi:septum formation inhibitor-activating ATPase MinD